jgi:hypothetical protein
VRLRRRPVSQSASVIASTEGDLTVKAVAHQSSLPPVSVMASEAPIPCSIDPWQRRGMAVNNAHEYWEHRTASREPVSRGSTHTQGADSGSRECSEGGAAGSGRVRGADGSGTEEEGPGRSSSSRTVLTKTSAENGFSRNGTDGFDSPR